MKNPNLRFIFGIILIICGWVICFDIFLLMIGIPFFLLGTILVLFSRKSVLVKIITVGLPILLWFIGFEIILHEINKPTSITILLPENFSGEFRIIEGEKNGVAVTEENGRKMLTIPANGILITQAHLNLHQNTDFEFYYLGANGVRVKSNNKTMQSTSPELPGVAFNGMLSPPTPPGQSSDVPRELDYLYDSFSVVTNSNSGLKSVPAGPGASALMEIQTARMDSLVKIERGMK